MSNYITYNNIVDILTDIANRHQIINSFYLGENWDIENDGDIKYPVFQVYPTLARLPRTTQGEYKTIQISMLCKVVNLTRQDQINEQYSHSDMLQIGQDIINELNQNPYFQNSNVTLLSDIQLTPLTEFNDDYTSGWEWTLTFQLINNNTFCGLPFDPIDGISYNGPTVTGYTYTNLFSCDDLINCPIIIETEDRLTVLESILFTSNQLLTGTVNYLSGTTYDITPLTYLIQGIVYNVPSATQVTLLSGDTLYDRIDVIYADVNGNTGVLVGEPSDNPVKPVIDTSTQVEITFVSIPANSTVPAGVSTTLVYNEFTGPPTEWTFTTNAPTKISANATNSVYLGTKSIRFLGATTTNYFQMFAGSPFDTTAQNTIQFAIKNNIVWPTGQQIRLNIYSIGGTQIGTTVTIANGTYGFSSTNLTTWQLINVPLTAFSPSTPLIAYLRFTVFGSGANQLNTNIDYIRFITGVPVVTAYPNWRYIKGDSVSTIDATTPNNTLIISGGTNVSTRVTGTNTLVIDTDPNILVTNLTATTISATNYLGLPVYPDYYVTGGTYSDGTLILNRPNGSVTITGFLTGGTSESFQYWTSGSTGNQSIKANNDSGLDSTGNYSVAEGFGTLASGNYSHAENEATTALGESSHAEGNATLAEGNYSHAEGINTWAFGGSSHAEGGDTRATGGYSHAEGSFTDASGSYSHTEGTNTTANGESSHAEGSYNIANGIASHVQNENNLTDGDYSHAQGTNNISVGEGSNVEGRGNVSYGSRNSVGGNLSVAGAKLNYFKNVGGIYYNATTKQMNVMGDLTSNYSDGSTIYWGHSDNLAAYKSVVSGSVVFVSGTTTVPFTRYTYPGYSIITIYDDPTGGNNDTWAYEYGYVAVPDNSVSEYDKSNSFVFGQSSVAEWGNAAAFGYYNKARKGGFAHGLMNIAEGWGSHAEGYFNIALGSESHAEGYYTDSIGIRSHTEGIGTDSTGNYSHAEGGNTNSVGQYSHAEGWFTTSNGEASHTEGLRTIADGNYQSVVGQYNVTGDTTQSAFIIGNGIDNDNRSNLLFAAGNEVNISGKTITTTLNIQQLGIGTSVNNLGIDVNGDVIIGDIGVQSVTGTNVDNTDPLNPIVNPQTTIYSLGNNNYIAVDDTQIQIFTESGSTSQDILITPGDFTIDGESVAVMSDLPTKTSELINDGDDGISHFITLNDLPSNVFLYSTTATDIPTGYNKLVTSINDPDFDVTAVDVSTGHITTTGQLVGSLISAPNIFVGNPGVFNITTTGNIRKTHGSGTANFYFEAYKRDSIGTETLITTSVNTVPVTNTLYSLFSTTGLWNNGDFVSTDRIVLKFYANRIAGGSNPIYDFQFGGGNPVRTLLPVPLTVIPSNYIFTGGTVTGPTYFPAGLTASTVYTTSLSADTIYYSGQELNLYITNAVESQGLGINWVLNKGYFKY